MKKSILVLCSIGLFTLVSYGQEAVAATHVAPQTVLAKPSLKAQAEKIQQKEQQLSQVSANTRAVNAQVKEELAVLNAEYKNLLIAELQTAKDETERKELSAELRYVEKQLGMPSSSR